MGCDDFSSFVSAAAYQRAFAISAFSKSGYTFRTSRGGIPSPSIPITVATGIRRPRIHATPPILSVLFVMRSITQTPLFILVRQVTKTQPGMRHNTKSAIHRTMERLDSERGRYHYSRRMGVVEPVFGNTRASLGLDRFTLRGRRKVDTQWKLYCIVHNIGKFPRMGRRPLSLPGERSGTDEFQQVRPSKGRDAKIVACGSRLFVHIGHVSGR